MAENQNVIETEQKPSLGARIGGGIKERLRKFVVNLKRRPMNVAFFVLIVSSLIYLFSLGKISQAGLGYPKEGVPISIFVNTLFSILVLLLFMYAFPKRAKKPKVVMLVLAFVFMAVMLGLDILLYVQWNKAWIADQVLSDAQLAPKRKFIFGAINGVLVHAIFLGLAALLTATYPLYGKLIKKINTRKVVESTQLTEALDTEQE